jgi:hypothetical protein
MHYVPRWWRNIRDHAGSHLAELNWERGGWEPITTMEVVRTHWAVALEHLYYAIGARVCRCFGHSKDTEVSEFVNAERDARGRIVDIDGGGVDWYCPRCGMGGTGRF